MGQGGGIVMMTVEERAEGQRLGAEPGACGARERSRATNRAAVRCLGDWAGRGEIVPSGGTGPGLSIPCDRSDCEWVDHGLRPVSERSTMMTGTPCPRWVRLASEDAEKERVRQARLMTYPDTLTGPYTREEAVAQAGLWWARRADFWFAGLGEMHDRMDNHMDVPPGASVFALFEFRGDNRAWISLDGNWHHDAVPIEPPMTYDEAFAFLSRCAVAPPWRGRCEKVEPNAKPVGYGSNRDMDRGLSSYKVCVVRGLHLTATSITEVPMSDPVSLSAGRYFCWEVRQFGQYTPSYGDSMGEVVGYFTTDQRPYATYSMTNAEARAKLVQPFTAKWILSGSPVSVVRVLDDSGDVVVLPLGWSARMLDDPNFRITRNEQAIQLIPDTADTPKKSGPSSAQSTAKVVHTVATDDPALATAVVLAISGQDAKAVDDIATRYGLTEVEAADVFRAVVGYGKRPNACYLDPQGRLLLAWPELEGAPVGSRTTIGGLEVDTEADGRLDAMMARHTAGWKTHPLVLEGDGGGFTPPAAPAKPRPALFDADRPDWLPEGWTHRLGDYTGPKGERVFTHAGRHAVAWGSRHADIEAWTEWTEQDKRAMVMALADPWRVTGPGVDALGRLGADGGFKIPDSVVKSMGLVPGDFVYVVPDGDRFVLATSEIMQAMLDGGAGSAFTNQPALDLDAPYNTCPACGAPAKITHYPADDDGPALWSLTCAAPTGSCWELLEAEQPFTLRSLISLQLSNAPILQGVAMSALDRAVKPPAFTGMAKLRDDGFPQELNRLILHPAGLALALTQEDDGRVVDVTVMEQADPAGWAFCFAKMTNAERLYAADLSEKVADAISARARTRRADPDLGSVIEALPVAGVGTWEHVTGMDAQALRTSAQSFILADTCLDATAYEKGAHDAATAILRGDLSKGDPRVTLHGQLVEARSALHHVEAMHARLEAVMLAETGQRGLPGWVWDDSLPEDWTITFPGGCSASAWGRRGKTSAGFSVCRDRTITLKTDATDALTAMEQATAWARARGYTETKPDLEGTLSLEVRTGIAMRWRGGCIPDAVEEYRNAFEAKGESMTYQEGRCALHMAFMPEPARVVVPAGSDEDDFIPV